MHQLSVVLPLPDRTGDEAVSVRGVREQGRAAVIRDILHVASPGMRPIWIDRERWLKPDDIVVLRLALEAGDWLRWNTVYRALGERRATAALNRLKIGGALNHPGYNRYIITEKGKIALALAIAKGKS